MGTGIHSLGFSISSLRSGQFHIHSFHSLAHAQKARDRKKGSETQSHFAAGSFSRKHAWCKSSSPNEIPRLSAVSVTYAEGLMSATGYIAAALYTGLKARTIAVQSSFPLALRRHLKFKSNHLTTRYAKIF